MRRKPAIGDEQCTDCYRNLPNVQSACDGSLTTTSLMPLNPASEGAPLSRLPGREVVMRSVLISGILVGAFSLNASWAVGVQPAEHNLRPVTQLADIIPVRRPVRTDIIPV